jgi:hypothetical protein
VGRWPGRAGGGARRNGYGGSGWPAGELRRARAVAGPVAAPREAGRGMPATRVGAAAAAQHGRAAAAESARARRGGSNAASMTRGITGHGHAWEWTNGTKALETF